MAENAQTQGVDQPVQKQFTITLDKVLKGTAVLPNASCVFSVNWDKSKNMGTAELISIDGTNVNITLHPIGLQGQLDFMSDMPPTPYTINGKQVVIYRVILDMSTDFTNVSAVIMFGQNGQDIQASSNFSNEDLLNR